MAQRINELWSKGEEARINENLASICRALDDFRPRIKANFEHGALLTGVEESQQHGSPKPLTTLQLNTPSS
ncbi:MAG: hypothetical protein IPJ76_01590 [Flavobacteriales bacterium]|nr:MAG: hypothetical protein IPJ76_01590 [Flavobacteriales bacterium]